MSGTFFPTPDGGGYIVNLPKGMRPNFADKNYGVSTEYIPHEDGTALSLEPSDVVDLHEAQQRTYREFVTGLEHATREELKSAHLGKIGTAGFTDDSL